MMKKSSGQKPTNANEALEILYGNNVRDLSPSGYTEAIQRLRQSDKAQARRIERILAPFLKERVFPRRKKKWYETSIATRARLILLPGNPHLQTDVSIICEMLQIPVGHVTAPEGSVIVKQLETSLGLEKAKRVAEWNMAGYWLYIHREAALGRPTAFEEDEMLSLEMHQLAVASARVDLQSNHVPEWLRPLLVDSGANKNVPLEQAALKLAQRHNLPQRTVTALILYILTQDASAITGLDPLDVEIKNDEDSSGDQGNFTLSLRGIDEFVTKEDWDSIWVNYVKPRQKRLLEQRGIRPQGRRTIDIERLRNVLPSYQEMVWNNWKVSDLLLNLTEELTDWDQETIRRTITDLKQLLAPRA